MISTAGIGYRSGLSHTLWTPPGSGLPPQLVLTQVAADNFNRANGPLAGSNNWLATSEGTMNIASNEAIGTAATALGNYRTNETYSSNQYAQCTVGSVALVSGGYIGLSVRNQDNANNYTGLYFNSAGTYHMQLYKKVAGTFTLVADNTVGASSLPQGTQLQLVAEGSQITFSAVSTPTYGGCTIVDTTFTGGVPGIESFGANSLDNWAGGNAATTVLSTAGASDNFNRANGGVSAGQANWEVMTYSPAVGATVDDTIVTNQIDFTTATVHGGDTRTDAWASDHWSQIQQGTVAMTATGFTFATVRCQNGGRSGYIGGLFQNAAYQIYRLDGVGALGTDTSTLLAGILGGANDPAGTPYTMLAKGSRISLRVNGVEVLSATDGTYTGGAPGLMSFATASADNWSAGNT